jgi:hypothetical protein
LKNFLENNLVAFFIVVPDVTDYQSEASLPLNNQKLPVILAFFCTYHISNIFLTDIQTNVSETPIMSDTFDQVSNSSISKAKTQTSNIYESKVRPFTSERN